MSNGDRWMPLYVADYLGDTMHLTTLQHGAYILLLMHYWKTGPLPDDQEALAAITKVDAKTWPSVWGKLMGFFVRNGDGTLHQKRMDKERDHWTDLSEKRREAGKRGAEAKHRPHPSNGSAPPTPLPQTKHEQPPVVPRHVIPQPDHGNRLGKPVAIARTLPAPLPHDLPAPLPAVSGNCQDFASRFATPPVPSKEDISSLSLEKKCAREAELSENGKDFPREPVALPEDGLKLLLDSLPPPKPPFKPAERNHSLDVQKAAVSKPQRPKACYASGPALAMIRRQGMRVVA